MPFSKLKLREITVAQRVLTSAGYAVYEQNENDVAIALNPLVTARIFTESKVQGILPALRQSEKVMFDENQLFSTPPTPSHEFLNLGNRIYEAIILSQM